MNGLVLALLVAVAGGLGSMLRFAVDAWIGRARDWSFPVGIVVVNLTGSLAAGVLLGAVEPGPVATVAGVGFLGGYTTFSTAILDTVDLARSRRYAAAMVHGPGVAAVCVLAALAGLLLTS